MSTASARTGSGPRFAVPNIPRILVYVAGLLPAAWLFYLAFTDQIGADPVAQLEWGLGLWALRLLIATLCITPLRQLFRINLLRYRRAVGLLSFYYVLMHLSVWVVLDRGLDLHAALTDILRRPYITIGMAAFVILVPLAITSNNWSIREMGGKAWAKLHKLVYAAVALGALHFIMIKKVWLVEPLVYATIVLMVLGFRLAWPYTGGRKKARKTA
ncbi:protein-methionine-sulfoxide reductase heme-binding subunit MsrQ [Labrys monachus]|uniref:Protein-methionine-sulfoxide reductase heme-binding subunit MsrQ n=1 Tax=Labrys monachus TaxID=217067 RepID=A0ABU0FEU9_9HYPH|nr:protein-methionine-sulfoxide reductase heme-binding subunit MsrQ [Labrys monachus]MDQ0392852.1 sulfoxide reductase heme-binding subunit YedZ [Labrys monachus]